MNEILEKLRVKTPEVLDEECPEPITARVSRERESRKKVVSPPELNFRSPRVISRFGVNEVGSKDAVSTKSMENANFRLRQYGSLPGFKNDQKSNQKFNLGAGVSTLPSLKHSTPHSKLLISSTLGELKSLNQDIQKISSPLNSFKPNRGYLKVIPLDEVQEFLSSITLFQSFPMFRRLLSNFPTNFRLDSKGQTVSHYVSEKGTLQMLEEVKRHLDDLDLPSKEGLTASMLAASRGRLTILHYLWKNGCKLDKKDFICGWTCLHHAVYNNQYETVVWLVKESKVLIGIQDFRGLDALDLAKMKNFSMISKFLKNFIVNAASWALE
jgi:hypothetical protein